MSLFTESVVEEAVLNWFRQLNYVVVAGGDLSPELNPRGLRRENYSEVVLFHSLQSALQRLNPALPPAALDEAFRKLTRISLPSLVLSNHAAHRTLVDGVNVEYQHESGRIAGAQVRVLDFDQPENNDWLVVNQFTVVENRRNRRR